MLTLSEVFFAEMKDSNITGSTFRGNKNPVVAGWICGGNPNIAGRTFRALAAQGSGRDSFAGPAGQGSVRIFFRESAQDPGRPGQC